MIYHSHFFLDIYCDSNWIHFLIETLPAMFIHEDNNAASSVLIQLTAFNLTSFVDYITPFIHLWTS